VEAEVGEHRLEAVLAGLRLLIEVLPDHFRRSHGSALCKEGVETHEGDDELRVRDWPGRADLDQIDGKVAVRFELAPTGQGTRGVVFAEGQ
jgi:hypothetical protein